MFHVLREERELEELQEHRSEEDSGIRRRGGWEMRDEIFRETTAGLKTC